MRSCTHFGSKCSATIGRLLQDRELITQARIDLLPSWRHSGFAVHNQTTVYPSDTEDCTLARRSLGEGGKLACYLMRSPVNLSRLRYHPDSQLILYEPKAGHELDEEACIDPLEFLARVLIHVPEPNKHLVHFCGAYVPRVSGFGVDSGNHERNSTTFCLARSWSETTPRRSSPREVPDSQALLALTA